MYFCFCFFFFFQAEDGIRDHCVTGVQTCALPISKPIESTMAILMLGLLTLPIFGDHPEQSWDQWVTDFERACHGYGMDEARMLSIIFMYLEAKAAKDFREVERAASIAIGRVLKIN